MELIGREAELAALVERLAGRRLVTVTGPGGVGKTALARAALDRLAGGYELGGHARRPHPRRDARRRRRRHRRPARASRRSRRCSTRPPRPRPCSWSTTASTSSPRPPMPSTGSSTPAGARRSSPPAARRSTSRGESLVVLGPARRCRRRRPTTSTRASAQLFVERALDAGVELGAEHAAAVAALCRRLDGVPLALELAAARTRTMAPAEILARLGEGVDVLARPRFRGARRHRSIAETIDWSYQLLAGRGGRAARPPGALCAGPVRRSLAPSRSAPMSGSTPCRRPTPSRCWWRPRWSSPTRSPAGVRFRLLETVRAFAVDRLRAAGLLEEARARLADHVVDDAMGFLAAGGYRWDRSTVTGLLARYDDIVASLAGACREPTGRATTAPRAPVDAAGRGAVGRRAPGPHRRDRRALRAGARPLARQHPPALRGRGGHGRDGPLPGGRPGRGGDARRGARWPRPTPTPRRR